MTFSVAGTTKITTDRIVQLTNGSVRPSSPTAGTIFYNTSSGKFEVYTGSAWKTAPTTAAVETPSLWGWGRNDVGQLGNGSTYNASYGMSSPVSAVGGFTDWIQISAGFGFATSAAIRANGTAWSWGKNNKGQLGNNTAFVDVSSPVSVVGGFTDWTQISTNGLTTVAVRANGTAWSWGYNNTGQLGIGSSGGYRSSPVSVVGGFTNWIQISMGAQHTVAIRANGTAWAWGLGSLGRLGDNALLTKNSPVSVIGGFTDWIQIQGAGTHTIALRANGTIWSWGGNSSKGCLGNGSTTGSSTSPISVVGGFTDWVQISSSMYHTLAIRSNGSAWGWGYNQAGRIGDNTTTIRNSPVSVIGGFTDWVQVNAGTDHSHGIRANGTAWGWGLNTNGRLGIDNSISSRRSPESVVGGFTDWVQVVAGYRYALGLRTQPRKK